MYVFIGAEKYSCSIIVSIFSKYVIVKYRKPALKKFKFTRGKFTFTLEENMKSIFYQFISWLKLIAWRIYIKMPQKKTFMGCLLLKSVEVFKISFAF